MFWFELASLWGCPVSVAQAICSASEFMEWAAFYRLRPWGCEKEDSRAALMPLVFAAAFSEKGSKPKLEDFMPSRQEKEHPSPNQLWDKFQMLANTQNTLMRSKPNG